MKTHAALVPMAALALALSGCMAPAGAPPAASSPDPAHNARNALDWAGAYRGVLPCADCPGIETVIVLTGDGTYREKSRYLERDVAPRSEEGRFTWNAAGSVITLAGSASAQYFVGENRLIRLAGDGSRITGPLAEHYVLTKIGDGVTEKYWKLVELRGQPVPALERAPYLILKAEGGRVEGYGGCNGFGGSYEIDEAASRIRFGHIASTMRACATGMDVESAFHEVLRMADNYTLAGDRLTLNRARMAPLARFEAVYLR